MTEAKTGFVSLYIFVSAQEYLAVHSYVTPS